MREQFQVGEIAILAIHEDDIGSSIGYNGAECTIAGPLRDFHTLDGNWALLGHRVIARDGRELIAGIESLRKRRPPATGWAHIEELTRWNPAKVGICER